MLYLNDIPFRTLGRNEFSSVFQVEDFECLVQKCTWLPWSFGSSKIFWRHQMASNLGFHLIFVNWQLCEVCIAWLPENLSYYSSRWNDDGWYTYCMLLIQCTTVSWWKSSKNDSILRKGSLNFMASQPTPPLTYPPPRNKGLIAGLIKGNQWLTSLFITVFTVIQFSYIISASPLTIISKDVLNIQLVTHFQGISWNRWGWWVNCWMVRYVVKMLASLTRPLYIDPNKVAEFLPWKVVWSLKCCCVFGSSDRQLHVVPSGSGAGAGEDERLAIGQHSRCPGSTGSLNWMQSFAVRLPPSKTNIRPENCWLEDVNKFPLKSF